jgi:L-alanine-DL-glutamate epimerase-like enolase superfamily enzyme
MRRETPVTRLAARVFTVPTDQPESDGTISWDSTTLVLAEVEAGGQTGLGYSYASKACVPVIDDTLRPVVLGLEALDVAKAWEQMWRSVRNLGSRGLAACAISAVDVALWDLKAKLLNLSLAELFGRRRDAVMIYGSGGFCSYDEATLRAQLGGWVENEGCAAVKMKIGRQPDQDPLRCRQAREAIGEAQLFVDANGAFSVREALAMIQALEGLGVTWFEEPVTSDDLPGLSRVRDGAPAKMDVAAGEYGYDPFYFHRMLDAGAVDVIQADATRCLGYSGFLLAAALAEACNTPLSSHCGPALHLPAACAAPRLRHMEWFHDHVRLEAMLFDGVPKPTGGYIRPDLTAPGHGLVFKAADAARFAV